MNRKDILNKFGNDKYHVTPDTFKMGIHYVLGKEIAKRFIGKKIIADMCVGAGFMALCLAEKANQLIAVDIKSVRLDLVKENADIAGLSEKFKYIEGDVLDKQIFGSISKIDAIFADPDWALPKNAKGNHVSSVYKTGPPIDVLFNALQRFTANIAIRLPKEINLSELNNFPAHETEAVYLDNKLKFYTIYFGDIMKKSGNTELFVKSI